MKELLAEARFLQDDVVTLRRRIHRRPEIGLDLPNTQAAVLEALDGLPLEVRTGRGLSSVVAVLQGEREGPTLLLRADMDALPMPEDTGLPYASEFADAMHACGHDAHTAMLVGAARLLSRHRSEIAGSVLFMFQPGEEGYGGAKVMLDEGLLEGVPVSGAFAIHCVPNLASGRIATRAGTMMAASDRFTITITGRSGHASAPHRARDPVAAAAEVVLSIQTAVTRRVDVFDPAVVTVTWVEAGTAFNVIPETAVLKGTIRTFTERTRRFVMELLPSVAQPVAAAHGCTASVDIGEGQPPTVNDAGWAGFVLEVAGEAGTEMPAPVPGAEDFSHVLARVPGALASLGVAPPGVDHPAPLHSNRMVLDEEAMAVGVALHAAVALRHLRG